MEGMKVSKVLLEIADWAKRMEDFQRENQDLIAKVKMLEEQLATIEGTEHYKAKKREAIHRAGVKAQQTLAEVEAEEKKLRS